MHERNISKAYDFDRNVFRDEMLLVDYRLNHGSSVFDNVESANKYETKDRDGKKLTILAYKKVIKESAPYELDGWFLFAVQNKTVVGYLGSHVEFYKYPDELVIEATTSYSVARYKGKGIGGALERVNNHLMQECANKNGNVTREVTGGNKGKIEKILRENKPTKQLLKEMIVSRQLWLALYGPESRGGFEWKNNFQLTKNYIKGDSAQLDMKVTKNEVPIGNVAKLVKRGL